MNQGKTDATQHRSRKTYLYFGGDEDFVYSPYLSTGEALQVLDGLGFTQNSLYKARKSVRTLAPLDLHDSVERYCDFCGRPLTGVTYVHLPDGRDRCALCTETVLHGRAAYESLCQQVREDMCMHFGIALPQSVAIRIVSQEELAKEAGGQWHPSKQFDRRDMGLVKTHGWTKRTQMLLESGCPRSPLMGTVAACYASVWQQTNWDERVLARKYGVAFEEVKDGMLEWVGIQFMYLINESRQAERRLLQAQDDKTAKGKGLQRYLDQYPLSKGVVLSGETPFLYPDEPIKVSA